MQVGWARALARERLTRRVSRRARVRDSGVCGARSWSVTWGSAAAPERAAPAVACPVCWAPLTALPGAVALACGHVYCDGCVQHVFAPAGGGACALCREAATGADVRRLYLTYTDA